MDVATTAWGTLGVRSFQLQTCWNLSTSAAFVCSQDHYVENQNCPREFLMNKNNRVLAGGSVTCAGRFEDAGYRLV